MRDLLILRGRVIGEPHYSEEAGLTHFLLALEQSEESTPAGDVLCQVRCAGRLASQVEALVCHFDPVIVVGTLRRQYARRADGASTFVVGVAAETVGHDLSRMERLPIL